MNVVDQECLRTAGNLVTWTSDMTADRIGYDGKCNRSHISITWSSSVALRRISAEFACCFEQCIVTAFVRKEVS